MHIQAIKTRVFNEQEDLASFITSCIPRVKENSIIVVTSKIAALSEGRVVAVKSSANKKSLIKQESTFALKTRYTWLTIKDGQVMASAGIDESNANGKLILLPQDSFATARRLRRKLGKHYAVKNLGLLITDSRTLPMRAGTTGVALGYAGFKGLKDYRGTRDLFGRVLKMSRSNVADALAAAAVLCMGEGSEQQPLALLSNTPVQFSRTTNPKELSIPVQDDLYAPLFKKLKLA